MKRLILGRFIRGTAVPLNQGKGNLHGSRKHHGLSLLSVLGKIYAKNSTSARVSWNVRSCFGVNDGLGQGCEMSLWLFNIYLGEVVREDYEIMRKRGVNITGLYQKKWQNSQLFFISNAALG